MKKIFLLLSIVALFFVSVGCKSNNAQGATQQTELLQTQMPKENDEIAVITTNMGTMKVMFFPEEAPKAVENFKTHAKEGYYDGLIFHRVINNFMIQGGDPTGTGAGGESIWGEPFEDEFSPKLHNFRGALSMANAGPNTNGSQFFIVQSKTVDESVVEMIEEAKKSKDKMEVKLNDGKSVELGNIFPDNVIQHYREAGGTIHLDHVFGATHTVFGQVFEGMDVVDKIAEVETGENDKPIEDVVIEKIELQPYQAQ